MRKLGIVFGIIVVIIVILAIGKNTLVKSGVEKIVTHLTGLELEIDSMDIGLVSSHLGIKGLKLHNPPGFDDSIMVDFPEIYVDYDLGAIMKKDIHLEEIRLHLAELVVVKNKAGEINLNALKTLGGESSKDASPKEKSSAKKDLPPIRIDVLNLRIDKVVYKNYSRGSGSTREFHLNLNERFENIDDPNKLVALIITKALMSTPLTNLAGLAFDELSGQVGDVVGRAQEIVSESLGNVRESLKSVDTAQIEETIAKTSGELNAAAKKLTEKIKFPSFGGK